MPHTAEVMPIPVCHKHSNIFGFCFLCRLDNFTVRAEKLFCIPHFKQMFMEKGNYDEGFGLEQHKDKWSNKGANCKANGVVDLVPNNGNDLIDGNGHMEPISQ